MARKKKKEKESLEDRFMRTIFPRTPAPRGDTIDALAHGISLRSQAQVVHVEWETNMFPHHEDEHTPINPLLEEYDIVRDSIDYKPHKKTHKTRKCYGCGAELSFLGYHIINQLIPYERLEKIWESPHIELYCCECFEKKLKARDKN